MTTKVRKTTKTVIVLRTYVFNHENRVCFVVLSDEGQQKAARKEALTNADTYTTCFDNGHASCTCEGHAKYHRECYHITLAKCARYPNIADAMTNGLCYNTQ